MRQAVWRLLGPEVWVALTEMSSTGSSAWGTDNWGSITQTNLFWILFHWLTATWNNKPLRFIAAVLVMMWRSSETVPELNISIYHTHTYTKKEKNNSIQKENIQQHRTSHHITDKIYDSNLKSGKLGDQQSNQINVNLNN